MRPACLRSVDHLSANFEARLLPKKPWVSDKMTPAKREAMLRAIVGIEMTVTKVEASWKLGQHKQPADQEGVIAAIEKQDTPAARDYLDTLKAWRATKSLTRGSKRLAQVAHRFAAIPEMGAPNLGEPAHRVKCI